MQYALTANFVDVTITYFIFNYGAAWTVERHGDTIQEIGRGLTKEQAVSVANADAGRWPACQRKVVSVSSEGAITLESLHTPE